MCLLIDISSPLTGHRTLPASPDVGSHAQRPILQLTSTQQLRPAGHIIEVISKTCQGSERSVWLRPPCVTDERAGQDKPRHTLLSPLQLSQGTFQCPNRSRGTAPAGSWAQAPGEKCGDIKKSSSQKHLAGVNQPAVFWKGSSSCHP